MKTPKIYYGILAVFCALILCSGIASAANLCSSATSTPAGTGAGQGHQFSPETIIAHLEQQGVDVTAVKAYLQNGDTNAAKTWFKNYRTTHQAEMAKGAGRPGFGLTNTTRQQQIITRLEHQGVDVTEQKDRAPEWKYRRGKDMV